MILKSSCGCNVGICSLPQWPSIKKIKKKQINASYKTVQQKNLNKVLYTRLVTLLSFKSPNPALIPHPPLPQSLLAPLLLLFLLLPLPAGGSFRPPLLSSPHSIPRTSVHRLSSWTQTRTHRQHLQQEDDSRRKGREGKGERTELLPSEQNLDFNLIREP